MIDLAKESTKFPNEPTADAIRSAKANTEALGVDTSAIGGVPERGGVKVADLVRNPSPSLLDGILQPTKGLKDIFFPDIVLTPRNPATPTSPSSTQSLGNPQFDGLLNQIVSLNGDIDSLLADYQKAVNGELLDANGKKVDPFVIQMKLQQAMQQRLEISNLLSTLLKMVHDGIEAITRNIV